MSISEEKAVTLLKGSDFNEQFVKVSSEQMHKNCPCHKDKASHSQGETHGNLVASITNISLLMGLLKLGSSGKTGEEIQKAFAFPPNDKELAGAYGKLIASLSSNGGCQIEVATALYAKKECQFRSDFLQSVQSFKAEVKSVDFTKSQDAAKEINAFVAQATKNKIDTIVSPDDLNNLTALVLVSAIYFKGSWKSKFDPQHTSKRPFTNRDGKQVQVDMMFKKIKCPYAELDKVGARAISLPYQGDRFKMVIILPNKPDGLEGIVKKLEPQFLQKTAVTLKFSEDVNVFLPKFRAECQLDLKPIFNKLQIKSMFSDRNELGGFFEKSPNLYVSKVVHKAFIEVNEEGTEAAAATAAIAMMRALPMTIEFMVDRPFLYYIFDDKFSTVLFVGSQVQF